MDEFEDGFEFELLIPSGEWVKLRFGIDKIAHSELDQFKDDKMKIAHAITRVEKEDEHETPLTEN